MTPFRGITGLFNEEVLLKTSDPRAVLTPFASEHRRSTRNLSLPSIRVLTTSPSWFQVYTTTFLVPQRSRVEQSLEKEQGARVSWTLDLGVLKT